MCFVVQQGMIFGAVISKIGNSGSPIVMELTLIITKMEPVAAHIHGFGAFGGDGIVCDSISSQVVSLEG